MYVTFRASLWEEGPVWPCMTLDTKGVLGALLSGVIMSVGTNGF